MSFWINAKRDGECKECEGDIREGDRMVYDPDEFKGYCAGCGEEVAGEDPMKKKERVKGPVRLI